MEQHLQAFKKIVIGNCNRKEFEYREWFVKDHLEIVERITLELCDLYPETNRSLVHVLAWFHDFGKPIDFEHQYEATKTYGIQALHDSGFSEDFTRNLLVVWERMEMKDEIDLSNESIDVKVISSADGASHFVGKFYPGYFRNDPNESLTEVERKLRAKIERDWNRKIVLPEVKEKFKDRYAHALEIVGKYPEKFLI